MTRKIRNDGKPIDISDRMEDILGIFEADRRIIAAYIYGSYGTPDQTPLSDVDLAVLFHRGQTPSFDEHLLLIGEVTAAAQSDDVSVAILNRLPTVSQFQIISTGRLIYLRDRTAHQDFQEYVFNAYGDYGPRYRRFLAEYDQALVEAYTGGQ